MAAEPISLAHRIELAEAVIELAMARHAEIQARGFDSIKQRARIHEQIDVMLDELSWLRIQAVIEAVT
jgi:hypothetical protein